MRSAYDACLAGKSRGSAPYYYRALDDGPGDVENRTGLPVSAAPY